MDTLAAFQSLDLRIGRVREVTLHEKARAPAYILRIDFGALGLLTSSAQLTDRYEPADLEGRLVVGVVNLPPRRVAGVKSEVLVLGAMEEAGVSLLRPDHDIAPGTRVA
ncbi:MAG: tRNA-binding protein [Phycisphaerales bacterium JB038]